jgi:hypothetical protein
VSSARRAADSLNELVVSTRESTGDLGETLRDVSAAARALRDFIDQLDSEPDMLLKGRKARR